jgi:hypothetical protein
MHAPPLSLSLLLKSMKWRKNALVLRLPPSARGPTARLPRVLRIRIRSRPLLAPFDFVLPVFTRPAVGVDESINTTGQDPPLTSFELTAAIK